MDYKEQKHEGNVSCFVGNTYNEKLQTNKLAADLLSGRA